MVMFLLSRILAGLYLLTPPLAAALAVWQARRTRPPQPPPMYNPLGYPAGYPGGYPPGYNPLGFNPPGYYPPGYKPFKPKRFAAKPIVAFLLTCLSSLILGSA